MTGSNALPIADEAAEDGSAQWAGVAKVLGPPWARFPIVTIGILGVQMMWSIELAYGEQSQQPNPILCDTEARSFAIPRLPWPLEIPYGPCLCCWASLRSHCPARHRSARLVSIRCPYHKLIAAQVSLPTTLGLPLAEGDRLSPQA